MQGERLAAQFQLQGRFPHADASSPVDVEAVCLETTLPIEQGSVCMLAFQEHGLGVASEYVPYSAIESAAIDELVMRRGAAWIDADLGLGGRSCGPFPRDILAPLGTKRKRSGVLAVEWRDGGHLLVAADASWNELSRLVFSTPFSVPEA